MWPTHRFLVAALAVAAAVVLVACHGRVVRVGPLEPAPALDLPRQSTRLALALDSADTLRVDPDGFPAVEVRGFRQSLTRGFERAFGGSFVLVPAARADRVLELQVHELALVTDPRTAEAGAVQAILVHGGDLHKVTGAAPPRRRYARLAFEATLRDRGGEAGRVRGYAVAELAASGESGPIAASITSAVVVLYERVGRELFALETARHP